MYDINLNYLKVRSQEGRKKEEGRRKKWVGVQNPTNCKHRLDGGVLNPKEKDNYSNQESDVRIEVFL
ncbi:MAG: hypothetical protein F6K54_27880 [Okeania sp. SIO3B5]|uniref:hypothetical protein n=1 Tax=Okeania sp. SIO3B5 TaxID=2607811 RepID=UPI00140137C0|nr:hypothetical protein [Okeania sp. SIO3B5]NEO56562.1 hypothetical protein [Okeania sp. SIO3B5]